MRISIMVLAAFCLGLCGVVAVAQVPTAGLIAYYPFSGNASDASGNGYNGTTSNVTLTSDRLGNSNQAYAFNGTSSIITIAGTSSMNLTSGFSLACWAKLNSGTTDGLLVGKHVWSVFTGYWIGVTNKQFVAYVNNDTRLYPNDAVTYDDGQWHFVVSTYDGSILKLYVDGQYKGSQTRAYTNVNSANITIGGVNKPDGTLAPSGFGGSIDEVRIYNRPLTETEISTLLTGNNQPASDLVAFWPMDDAGSTIADASGNGLNGTAGGTSIIDGVSGMARSFNGVSDYIEVPNNDLLNIKDVITVMMWAKLDQSLSAGLLICKRLYSPSICEINYDIYAGYSGSQHWLAFQYGTGCATGNNYVLKDLSGLYDGNWHHLAVSLRFGDPSSAQWVIDGVMRPGEWAKWSGALGGGTDLPPVSTYPLEMGRQLSSSPGYAKCSMDQVRLYHRAMSEIEIADIYNTERSQPQEPEQTTLTMTTPVNQCRTGDYVDFVATLKDSKGNPISGKTIDFTWSYTGLDPAANFAGSWTGTTDLLGQCPLHWFSKWAAFTGNVAATVTAEFDGITGLGPANAAKQLVVIAISARLKGYAFEDCNGNGRIDPDDNMLIGAQITIISPYNNFSYPASGVPVTTGADGSFEAEVNQSGYSVSMPSYNITTTVNPTDFHMEDGSVLTAYAVLRYLPSQVAIVGSVTAHYPEGDVQTVRGATVTLYLANKPEQLKQAIGSTVTGENGLYMLDHIVSGQGYLLVADYSEIDARGLFRNWHGLTGIKSLPQSMIPNYDIQMQETYQRVDCLSDYIGGWSECLRLIDESMKDWKPIGCLSCLEAADDVCKVVKAAKETPDPGDGSKDYLLDDLAALTNLAMDVTVCGANILTACQGSAWDVIAFFTTFKKLDKLADASSCALGLLNDLRNMLGPSTSSAPQEQAFANALNQQSPEGLVGYTSSPVVIMVKDQAGGFLYRDSTRGVVTSSLGFPSWLSTFGDTHEFLYLSRSTADLELEILERQSPQPYDTIFGVTLIRPIGSGRFVCVEFQGVPTFSRTKATLSLADLGPQSRLRLDIDGDGQVDNYIAPFSVSYLTSGYSSLSGFVRKDSTGGLLGMPLDIYDSLGNVWTSVVTDDSGYYHVDSIPNGDYTIAVVTPLGYQADQETKEFTVNHIPVEVNFNLTKLSIAPRQRTRAYWADQLSKVLAGKPKDYTKTQFSRFASLIDQHFNDNRVNPIENYVVPQPATQTDSLKVLSRLLSYQPFASNEPFLKRLGRAELVTLMLNVVSGRVSQTQIVTRDSVTLSQAITYCDMLVNDLECPVGFLPVGFMAEYPRLTDILRYIKACFVAGFINVGITLPAGTIPLDIMDIAYKYAEDGKPLPSDFALGQNYPNPFNPATTIEFTLPVASYVQIEIFNILGQKVRELSSGLLEAGNHTVTWDGADTFGASVSSGIYLYRIHAGDFIDTKKMVLLK